MGRPRRPLDGVADLKDIRATLKEKSLERWKKQRLEAVQSGLAKGLSLAEIAEKGGVSPRTIGEWFERFRKGGVDSLLTRKEKGKGPASWLDARAWKDFRSQLAQGQWHRAEDARGWLQSRLKRKLSLVVIYKYLGKIAVRKKGTLVPKPAGSQTEAAPARRVRGATAKKRKGARR
jgi:transposase